MHGVRTSDLNKPADGIPPRTRFHRWRALRVAAALSGDAPAASESLET